MINKENFKLSIIIPCYNEKNTIEIILKRIIQNLNNYKFLNYEILIVDDCSTDGTIQILKQLDNDNKIVIHFHDKNLGKGAAIHTALKHLTGEVVIIQDADLEYDPSDYHKLLTPFFEANADIVYGSRFLTGYKVFKSSALKSISLKEKTFSFEPEVTIKLAKKKFKFFEVPIAYNGRSYDEGKKIGLKDAFIALKTIILYSLTG